MVIVGRAAYGLRIPAWMHAWPTPEFGAGAQRADAARQPVAAHTPIESRSRAAAIADAVAITQRREEIGRAHVELQSLMRISYAVFCLKKKKKSTDTSNQGTTIRNDSTLYIMTTN